MASSSVTVLFPLDDLARAGDGEQRRTARVRAAGERVMSVRCMTMRMVERGGEERMLVWVEESRELHYVIYIATFPKRVIMPRNTQPNTASVRRRPHHRTVVKKGIVPAEY